MEEAARDWTDDALAPSGGGRFLLRVPGELSSCGRPSAMVRQTAPALVRLHLYEQAKLVHQTERSDKATPFYSNKRES